MSVNRLSGYIAVYWINQSNESHIFRIITNAPGSTLGDKLKSAIDYCKNNLPDWMDKDVLLIASPINVLDLGIIEKEKSITRTNFRNDPTMPMGENGNTLIDP